MATLSYSISHTPLLRGSLISLEKWETLEAKTDLLPFSITSASPYAPHIEAFYPIFIPSQALGACYFSI